MALSKSVKLGINLQVAILCELCQRGESGEQYCTVCQKTLCNSCEILHSRITSCKTHKVVPRSEISSAYESEDVCRHHCGNMLVMECQKCSVLVCIECISDKHKGHSVVGIVEVYEREKSVLEKKVKEMEQHSLASLNQAVTTTTIKKDEYKKTVKNIKKEMENELKEFKREADRIHKQRLRKLEENENKDLNIMDEIESKFEEQKLRIENTITKCKRMLACGSQVELILFTKQSNLNPQVCVDTRIMEAPYFQAVNMNTINLSDILGKLKIKMADEISIPRQVVTPKIVSSFRSGLEGYTSLCTKKDGNTWVGGYESKRLNLVNVNGKVIRSRKITTGTCCLAVMDNEDIILCPNSVDSKAAMRLRVDGTEEIVYDASPSCCNGVSITKDQRMIICTSNSRVMMSDGTTTTQIYKGTGWINHAIELPDKTICISDSTHKGVYVIDRAGLEVNSITKPLGRTDFIPLGLAFDITNNLLVADYNNDCVYLISAYCDIKELVGKSHGIQRPYWLSIDKEDNLWIGQENGKVKIVKYYQ